MRLFFGRQALKKWTERQIDLFGAKGLQLHQIRIKNPGQATPELPESFPPLDSQGKDWTADAVWAHIEAMIETFKAKGLPPPIVHIHNHDTRCRVLICTLDLVPLTRESPCPSPPLDVLVLRRTSMVLPRTWVQSSSERPTRCDRRGCSVLLAVPMTMEAYVSATARARALARRRVSAPSSLMLLHARMALTMTTLCHTCL